MLEINGDSASGETYCLAHHISWEQGERQLLVMAIRYRDTFAKRDGARCFQARELIVDWTDTQALSA
jgi:hypothetical protein